MLPTCIVFSKLFCVLSHMSSATAGKTNEKLYSVRSRNHKKKNSSTYRICCIKIYETRKKYYNIIWFLFRLFFFCCHWHFIIVWLLSCLVFRATTQTENHWNRVCDLHSLCDCHFSFQTNTMLGWNLILV